MTALPNDNLFPIYDQMLPRTDREQRLGQRSHVFWLTGLSGSGKSTLALQLERRLFAMGYFVLLLDNDNIRSGLNAGLGFGEADRSENIRRIAEVAKLLVQGGVVVICSFISPLRSERDRARRIVGAADFSEVFVDAALELCEQRDVKGLYRRARRGDIGGFVGIHVAYEAPEAPDLHLDTGALSLAQATERLVAYAQTRIALP